MILGDFLKAIGQISDPRFRRVVFLGVLLSLALLGGVYALFLWGIESVVPGSIEIPFVGPVGGLDTLLSWGSFFLMLGLSIFLMVPAASAFSGLFLEDVVQAVEDRHYPQLPPAPSASFTDNLISSLNFFGLMVAVNIASLALFGFVGPLAPVFFWSVNGFLLGREYFTLVALRRLPREAVKPLRARHWLQIWIAGTLMAMPLSVPLINLVIPVLGVATFTHLFQRLLPAHPITTPVRRSDIPPVQR